MPTNDQEISWHVASHTLREHSNDWYWGLGGIAIVGAVLSILFGNVLLAVIIILGAGSIGFLAGKQPREHIVTVGSRGVSIDGTRYPYRSVHSFWVEEHDGPARLFLSLTGILTPHYALYLGEQVNPAELRALLKRHATEEEQTLPVGEHLAELLGL